MAWDESKITLFRVWFNDGSTIFSDAFEFENSEEFEVWLESTGLAKKHGGIRETITSSID